MALISGFEKFSLVTSDSKNWYTKHLLGVCTFCGILQKYTDDYYKSQINKIYENYSIYYQGNGSEQVVFTDGDDSGSQRSNILVTHLEALTKTNENGCLLDIGCGNGTFLKVFSKANGFWHLTGMDINDNQKFQIESIENTSFYSGDISNINNKYDVISLIHVLEHVIDPITFLRSLKSKLKKNGTLLIEVPYFEENAFDLLIVDHCTHFNLKTMLWCMTTSGYEVVDITTQCVHKEMTILAKIDSKVEGLSTGQQKNNSLIVNDNLYWFTNVITRSKIIAELDGSFGLFGTAIAATWLAGELGRIVDFFVDEDTTRIGQLHLGKPVYHPENIPKDSHVFIALPYETAKRIEKKYRHLNYHMPPVL